MLPFRLFVFRNLWRKRGGKCSHPLRMAFVRKICRKILNGSKKNSVHQRIELRPPGIDQLSSLEREPFVHVWLLLDFPPLRFLRIFNFPRFFLDNRSKIDSNNRLELFDLAKKVQ